MHLIIAVVGGSLLLLQVAVSLYRAHRDRIKLPGPKGWPLIGVGLDLPKRPRQTLGEWREKYGDTFKMKLGWYNWVFFNTPEAVKEVFDKQVGEAFRFCGF